MPGCAEGDLLGLILIALAIISIRYDHILLTIVSIYILEHGDIWTKESDAAKPKQPDDQTGFKEANSVATFSELLGVEVKQKAAHLKCG